MRDAFIEALIIIFASATILAFYFFAPEYTYKKEMRIPNFKHETIESVKTDIV